MHLNKDFLNPLINRKNFEKAGYKPLSAAELRDIFVGKKFLGYYGDKFVFAFCYLSDGTSEGINNYDHYDKGHWKFTDDGYSIDSTWELGWVNNVAFFYQVEDQIKLIDSSTGQWIATISTQLKNETDIKNYVF